MTDMTYPGSSLASLFNRHHPVGKDLAIDPDTQLQSYQEDIDHGDTVLETVTSEGLGDDEDDQDDDSDDE